AEKFQEENANPSGSIGHFPTEDEWITNLSADVLIAFFGYSESFEGPEKLDTYKAELEAFIRHTRSMNYNGDTSTQLVIVSPIAFENLSDLMELPHGIQENQNLSLYTEAMREVAANYYVNFVAAFSLTREWFAQAT